MIPAILVNLANLMILVNLQQIKLSLICLWWLFCSQQHAFNSCCEYLSHCPNFHLMPLLLSPVLHI